MCKIFGLSIWPPCRDVSLSLSLLLWTSVSGQSYFARFCLKENKKEKQTKCKLCCSSDWHSIYLTPVNRAVLKVNVGNLLKMCLFCVHWCTTRSFIPVSNTTVSSNNKFTGSNVPLISMLEGAVLLYGKVDRSKFGLYVLTGSFLVWVFLYKVRN